MQYMNIAQKLFDKLQTTPELSNVTFFQMRGPVDVFQGKTYEAKYRKLQTMCSLEAFETMIRPHELGDGLKELEDAIVSQIFEEIMFEISTHGKQPLVFGLYEVVTQDIFYKRRKEFMLRYDIQEEQKV